MRTLEGIGHILSFIEDAGPSFTVPWTCMWPDLNVCQLHTGEINVLLKTTAFEEVSSSQISCVLMEPMFPGVCVWGGGDKRAQCHHSECNYCLGLCRSISSRQQVPAGDVGVWKDQCLTLLGWEEKGREWLLWSLLPYLTSSQNETL